MKLELTDKEAETLFTYLASTTSAPDYWPGASVREHHALARVVHKLALLSPPQSLVDSLGRHWDRMTHDHAPEGYYRRRGTNEIGHISRIKKG